MKLKKSPKGIYQVSYRTEHGTRRTSTGSKNKEEAEEIVKRSKVKELEMAARATTLTSQVVSQIVIGRKTSIEQLIPEWVGWLRIGREDRTVHNNEMIIKAWIRDQKLEKLSPYMIKPEDIDEWVNNPQSQVSKGRRLVCLSSIRTFFSWATAMSLTLQDPSRLVHVRMSNMTHKQKEPRQRGPMSDKEIETVLEYLLENEAGVFWNAAVLIARDTGLRLGDIAQLEWDCLEKPGKIIVWTDKRDRRVELPLTDALSELFESLPQESRVYLFPNERALARDPKRRSTLSVYFVRFLQRAGIEGHSFHSLRYSYICAQEKLGMPVHHISQSVGHVSTWTTEGYLRRGRKAND